MMRFIPTKNFLKALLALFPLALLPFWTSWGSFLWSVFVGGFFLLSFYSAFLGRTALLACSLKVKSPSQLFVEGKDEILIEITLPKKGKWKGAVFPLVEGPLEVTPFCQDFLGNQAKLTFHLRPLKRGKFYVKGFFLRLTSQLGLWEVEKFFAFQKEGRIFPNIRGVGNFALRFLMERDRAGLKVQRLRGQGSEFDALLEYTPGMDIRNIDWKASARRMKLIAREFRIERNHDVILALDCGHLMAAKWEGLTKLDYAINALLHVAYVAVATGDRVGFLAFDQKVREFIHPQGKPSIVHVISERCTEISYAFLPSNYVVTFEYLLSQQKKRSLVILFTDFVDRTSAELLREYLFVAARRHLILFVAIRDPYLNTFVERPAESLVDMHCQVACYSLLEERELLFQDLKRFGIFCLDLFPSQIAVPVLNQYLAIRRRELI